MTSGQETERAYSYNPGARMGLNECKNYVNDTVGWSTATATGLYKCEMLVYWW